MERMLQGAGLDPKYWMDHFKNIGAITPAALKLLNPSHFDELSKFSDKPVETIALKKFLGVAKVSYRVYKNSKLSKQLILRLNLFLIVYSTCRSQQHN